MSFSIARLEGRALEHAISQQSGHGVRMKDPSSGKFVCICTAQTKAIRKYMKERVQTLVKDMASQGLHFAAGEAPVRLEDGEVKSVDVRCWLSSRQTYALLEMKWSRQGLPAALAYGRRSLGWLRSTARSGVWQVSRKRVAASVVGVLAVGPTKWTCEVEAVSGSWHVRLPKPAKATRKVKRWESGSFKRKGNAAGQETERNWRRSAKGKALQRELDRRYHKNRASSR